MEVLAQFVTNIISFLILLFILKKFAWGALLKLIDDRTAKIDSEFESIEKAKQEIEKLKVEYQEHLIKIEEETREKLQEAMAEGRKVRANGEQ